MTTSRHHHDIFEQSATKTAERGRASGGLAIGLNNLVYTKTELISASDEFIFIKTMIGETTVIIGIVYINQKKNTKVILDKIDEELTKINNKYYNSNIIIGGDFNARIADKGEIDKYQLPEQNYIFTKKRESQDTVINERGRDLIDFAEKNDLFIINGRFPSDTPADFTFFNTQGKSVIDLVLCNSEALLKIIDVKVCNSITLSDHFPISLTINFTTKLNQSDKYYFPTFSRLIGLTFTKQSKEARKTRKY